MFQILRHYSSFLFIAWRSNLHLEGFYLIELWRVSYCVTMSGNPNV